MTTSTLNQHASSSFNAETFRQIRTSILLLAVSAFIQANLVGCLLLPTPSSTILEKPFQDETKSSIKVGTTRKEDVENILGTPDATRRNGSIYIYAKPYVYMKLWGFFQTGGSVRDIESHHLLIVQFDRDGIVKNLDHITGNGSKTQNGIYVADAGLRARVSRVYGTIYPGSSAPISQMLVLYAPSDMEENVKQFSIPVGKSAIYVYQESDYLDWMKPENAINKVSVSLDNIELGDFGPDGFFYWIVDAGSHSIRVTPIYPSPQHCHPDALTIEGLNGQISFVELTWVSKGFLLIEQHTHLNLITDSDKGRKEILKRRMILDTLCSID